MAKFEWDSSIELGIPVIDEQHKALFGWVNELNDSVLRGDGAEAAPCVLHQDER